VFELSRVGATTVLTTSPKGESADGSAFDYVDISADGRYVAFMSFARNLTPQPVECGGPAYCETVYVRDRVTGVTTAVATGGSDQPQYEQEDYGIFHHVALSADGRYVAFEALPAADPHSGIGYRGAPDAPPNIWSLYVYDRVTNTAELASRNSAGEPARPDPVRPGPASGSNYLSPSSVPESGSGVASLSADGRFVAFISDAVNLGAPPIPANPSGRIWHVFVRDRVTGTTRVVLGDATSAYYGLCSNRSLSGDGRFLVFMSSHDSTQGDRNEVGDRGWLWDAEAGTSRRLSAPDGSLPQSWECPSISLDGTHVGFYSPDALVPDDTNKTIDQYEYTIATAHLDRISVRSDGSQADKQTTDYNQNYQRRVTLSADGRYAAFDSSAPDLAPSTISMTAAPGPQVYVHDLATGATTLAAVTSTGEPIASSPGEVSGAPSLRAASILPSFAADASAIAFIFDDAFAPGAGQGVAVHDLR
jgi:Tol biopolymer transport system component